MTKTTQRLLAATVATFALLAGAGQSGHIAFIGSAFAADGKGDHGKSTDKGGKDSKGVSTSVASSHETEKGSPSDAGHESDAGDTSGDR